MQNHTLQVSFQNYSVEIPYIEFCGTKQGPHIFLSGGMHGDEINGVAAINNFLAWAEENNIEQDLIGKITVLPLMNPSGFANNMREVYEDHQDLNRSFGKDEPTTFSEAIAKELTENIFQYCDIGLDFHDAGGRSVLLPHTRVHQNETCSIAYGCTRDIGRVFGTDIIIARDGKPGMMAIVLHEKYDIPVLTVETGGAQSIVENDMHIALQGIRNFLAAKKMYEGDIIVPEKQFFLYDRYGVKTPACAQIEFNVKLGDQVHAGDEIGKIYFPLTQKREVIKAPMCGHIFSLWKRNQIQSNMIMFSILEEKECHVERTTLDKFEELGAFDISKVEM